MSKLVFAFVFLFLGLANASEGTCLSERGSGVVPANLTVTGYAQPFSQPSQPCQPVTSVCAGGTLIPGDLYPSCTTIN